MNSSARRCCWHRTPAASSPVLKSWWTAVSMRCQFNMKFCDKHFLLSNGTARDLYHCTAARQPIIDYHCHLSPKDLAEDRHFANLHEPWLEGDHYKWRAMRANGVPEKFITGNDTSPLEKFQAWAATVPKTLRNPLFNGRTWNYGAASASKRCWKQAPPGQSGRKPTGCWRGRAIQCAVWLNA